MKRTSLASTIELLANVLTHPFGAVLLVLVLIALGPVVASTAGIDLSRQKSVAFCDSAGATAARIAP